MNQGFSDNSTSYTSAWVFVTVRTAVVEAPGFRRTSVRAGLTESAQAGGIHVAKISPVDTPAAMRRARFKTVSRSSFSFDGTCGDKLNRRMSLEREGL